MEMCSHLGKYPSKATLEDLSHSEQESLAIAKMTTRCALYITYSP